VVSKPPRPQDATYYATPETDVIASAAAYTAVLPAGKHEVELRSRLDAQVHNFPLGTFIYSCHDNSGPGGSEIVYFSHAVEVTNPSQSTLCGAADQEIPLSPFSPHRGHGVLRLRLCMLPSWIWSRSLRPQSRHSK
jgi:hypothetical protein